MKTKGKATASAVKPVSGNATKVTGLRSGWEKYIDEKGSFWGVDLLWNAVPGVNEYVVYLGSKKVETCYMNACYGIRVNTGVTNTFYVSTIKGGKLGPKVAIAVKPRTSGSTGGSSGSTGGTSTGGTTGGSTGGTTSGRLPEYSNITFGYVSGSFHLGQTWSSSLNSTLAKGASGTMKITRKKIFEREWDPSKAYDVDVYLYDTVDYNNFLIVYVANNQIIAWFTNRANMGKEGNNILMRGDTDKPKLMNWYSISNASGVMTQYSSSPAAVLMGGFALEEFGYIGQNFKQVVKDERKVGFHMVNAFRYIMGVRLGRYSNALSGADFENNTLTLNGKRFGAQPWAETMNASKKSGHWGVMSAGPLAVPGVITDAFYYNGAASYCEAIGTNVDYAYAECVTPQGPTGEFCVKGYESSKSHMDGLADVRDSAPYTALGIGISGNYNCVEIGKGY